MKKRFLTVILSVLMLFSCVLSCVACGGEEDSVLSGSSSNGNNVDIVVDDTRYFLKNNASDYAVVIPENASEILEYAASEFVGFFREATGLKLPVYTDTNRIFKRDSKYFSIGKTTLFQQAGLKITPDFYESGVIIQTVENSVFMCGGGDDGSLYAVYDMLGELFNYEYYGRGCYSLDKNVSNVALRKMSVCYEPSFEYRSGRTFFDSYDVNNMRRFRHEAFLQELIPVNTKNVHNCFDYVKDDIGVGNHEQYWTSSYGSNICFTAHGNKEEYNALIEAVAKTAINTLKGEPTRKYMLIALEDCEPACGCPTCNATNTRYGANSAAMILLCNDVRAKIDEWFAGEGKEYARDDFYFGLLAYMDTEDAPVVYNEDTQTYEGKDGIKCNEGVVVMYAPIYHDYTRPLSAKVNETTRRNFLGWGAITDTLILWGYDQNYQSYYTMYDTLGYAQEFARLAKESGVEYHFMQGNTHTAETDKCNWNHLHEYVLSKLAWNVDEHVPTLIDNFFDNFYGPASEAMKAIYTEQTLHCSYMRSIREDFGGRFSCETSNLKAEFWPKALAQKWIDDFGKAHQAIARYKEDEPELYQEYYERIASEEASPLFIVLSLYQGEFDSATIAKYKARFKQISSELGIIGDKGAALNDTLTSLGISF